MTGCRNRRSGGRRPGRAPAAVLAAAAALLAAGCTGAGIQRAAYESLHTVSDLENRDAPGYRSEPRDFDEYRRRRGEALGEGEQPDPMLPPSPVAPESGP